MFDNDTSETVQCRICGETMPRINDHHVRKHNKMTVPQYRERFPGVPTSSEAYLNQVKINRQNANKGKPAHNKGKPISEEQKKKQSEAMKGKQSRLGAVLSDETKKKISDSLKKYEYTEEHRQSLRDAIQRKKDDGTYVYPMQNYVMTDEHRRKSGEFLAENNKRRAEQAFEKLKESIEQYDLEFISNEGRYWTVLCKICNTKMSYDKQMFHPSKKPDRACPICYPRQSGTSKEEQSLYEAVKTIYNGEIIQNTYVPVKGFEIDIFLSDLKIGIEYNGLYWHACNNKATQRHDYHLSHKTRYAYKNDIKLLQIMSDEWNNRPDVVIGRIRNFINDPSLLTVENYEFREVESDNKITELYSFNSDNESDVSLGLYSNEELVAVFSLLVENSSMLISDIVIDPEYETGKICEYFVEFVQNNLEDITKINLHLDGRWFENILFNVKEAGFEYQRISDPNLWYTDYFNRYHPDNFENKSLEEMKELGYDWLYDCGYARWSWKR